jgi:hypothetical protein
MTQAFQIAPGQIGDKIIYPIWAGGRETHNSDTPLVVGAFAFNPDDYSLAAASVTFSMIAILANGTTPLTTHLHLVNITDAEVVASSALSLVDSTAQTKLTAALTIGSGAGEIKTGAEKIYECRIYLDAAPVDPETETIELYKAELRATFTVA